MNITEDYVSFETAKLLKEKGFKGEGEHFYEDNKITNFANYWYRITSEQKYKAIEAPTLQMAMKWLRDVHNICISVDVKIRGGKYYVRISSTENGLSYGVLEYEFWDTFEEACEESIKYCLENLINI
jgi:hypothetical protein